MEQIIASFAFICMVIGAVDFLYSFVRFVKWIVDELHGKGATK